MRKIGGEGNKEEEDAATAERGFLLKSRPAAALRTLGLKHSKQTEKRGKDGTETAASVYWSLASALVSGHCGIIVISVLE